MGVCRLAHDGKPLVLKEVEDLRHMERELAATVMWLSCTDVPQDVELAETRAPLPVESQPVRIKHRIAEQMVDCTTHDAVTGETHLQGQKM